MRHKIKFRKYSFFLICIGIVTTAIILACVDGDEADGPSSLFPPEITHSDKYSDFYFSYHVLYGSTDVKQNNISDFNNINITEWDGYFKNQVHQDDIKYMLYEAPTSAIDALIFSIKKAGHSTGSGAKDNSILQLKDTRSALDFLYYAGFAKRCEKYSTYQNYEWWDENQKDTNDPKYDKDGMAKLEDGGFKQITNVKSDFMKQRYAFQILRLYYMSGDYSECIQFYSEQKNILESNANSIKYRAMGYLAAAHYKQKEYSDANYLYSLMFDQYDTMRLTAYLSFHPQEEKDWIQTLAMAKSTREKEILWQMLGIYNDPERALKEVYALNPKSDLLDVLLARAVNVEEQDFLYQEDQFAKQDISMSLSDIKSDSIDDELVSFLKMVADKKNTDKPYEWDIAAGYLDWAKGNKSFQTYLDKAKADCGGDSLVLDEVRLIDLLNMVKTGKAGDKTYEQNVLNGISWLRGEQHSPDLRVSFADDFIVSNLASKYGAVGDKVKSACFQHGLEHSDLYNNAFLDSVLAFIKKENKTPFEEYALSEFKYDEEDILAIKAIKPLYAHRFKEVMEIWSKDSNMGEYDLSADPFVIHINDCHDCDAEDKSRKMYTGISFIKRMITLEGKLKSDPAHLAENYFLLANGCYNLSYFGNARGMYETKITELDNEFFEFRGDADMHHDTLSDFMSCSQAEEYYNKAMIASSDPEFKAKCCFMAAKCAQNQYYMKGGNAGYFDGGKYFKLLKASYAATKYYQEIINECGYFKTYLKSN
ncbi:MAG TPA: hypothetical protein VK808_08955 [Bacteroidia bacterium]|nr:hypothetical protein [Bacteroidia bacterium]